MCIFTYIDKTGDKVSYFFSLRGKNNGQIYTICIYTKIFGWKKWFGNKVINKKMRNRLLSLPQNHLVGRERFLHINQSLIGRATKQ